MNLNDMHEAELGKAVEIAKEKVDLVPGDDPSAVATVTAITSLSLGLLGVCQRLDYIIEELRNGK
jgi:hypothetical protein